MKILLVGPGTGKTTNIKKIIESKEKLNSTLVISFTSARVENQKLAELRDWLLPMLMNGQVTVK